MEERTVDILKRKSAGEPFPCKLGMRVTKVEPGYALVEMAFEPDMRNTLGTMHGGAIFSLIDEAFELSCNSHGTLAVALNMNITYIAPPEAGSHLKAEATEISCSGRTGTYQIMVTDDKGRQIAVCQALAYRKKEAVSFFDGTSL